MTNETEFREFDAYLIGRLRKMSSDLYEGRLTALHTELAERAAARIEALQSPSQPVVAEAVDLVRELMAAWPDAHLPPHDLAIRAANYVNTHPQASPPPVQGEVTQEHWSRQGIVRLVIQSIVESRKDNSMAVPAGKAADGILALLANSLAHSQPDTQEGEESRRLRIAWWNDMRDRGVSQDIAIAKIKAALHSKEPRG